MYITVQAFFYYKLVNVTALTKGKAHSSFIG